MSDDENKTPSKQTSSVPLKKETVRVTLKAADAPPAKPSATLPPTPPPTSPARPPVPPSAAPSPEASKPLAATAPAAGSPTKPRTPAPAPTIKLATSRAPVGAPTIALKTANAPLPGGSGSPSVSLPKATVALNPPTKPLSPGASPATAAGAKATLSTTQEDEDESGANTFMNILAGVGLVAAIAVLALQLKIANIWIGAEDADSPGDWSQLLE